MDNNMKLLAKIASRWFNLIALIFQNFPVGACPQTPLEEVCFAHCLCTQNIFHIAFSVPLQIFCLATPMLEEFMLMKLLELVCDGSDRIFREEIARWLGNELIWKHCNCIIIEVPQQQNILFVWMHNWQIFQYTISYFNQIMLYRSAK